MEAEDEQHVWLRRLIIGAVAVALALVGRVAVRQVMIEREIKHQPLIKTGDGFVSQSIALEEGFSSPRRTAVVGKITNRSRENAPRAVFRVDLTDYRKQVIASKSVTIDHFEAGKTRRFKVTFDAPYDSVDRFDIVHIQ